MDQNYIAPAAALKKLKTARSLPQTVYLYGATGYGKTELVRQYLSGRRYTYLSCVLKRRILSIITALALCLGLCPAGALENTGARATRTEGLNLTNQDAENAAEGWSWKKTDADGSYYTLTLDNVNFEVSDNSAITFSMDKGTWLGAINIVLIGQNRVVSTHETENFYGCYGISLETSSSYPPGEILVTGGGSLTVRGWRCGINLATDKLHFNGVTVNVQSTYPSGLSVTNNGSLLIENSTVSANTIRAAGLTARDSDISVVLSSLPDSWTYAVSLIAADSVDVSGGSLTLSGPEEKPAHSAIFNNGQTSIDLSGCQMDVRNVQYGLHVNAGTINLTNVSGAVFCTESGALLTSGNPAFHANQVNASGCSIYAQTGSDILTYGDCSLPSEIAEVTIPGDLKIETGKTFTIGAGQKIIFSKDGARVCQYLDNTTLINNGTLEFAHQPTFRSGTKLVNNGTLIAPEGISYSDDPGAIQDAQVTNNGTFNGIVTENSGFTQYTYGNVTLGGNRTLGALNGSKWMILRTFVTPGAVLTIPSGKTLDASQEEKGLTWDSLSEYLSVGAGGKIVVEEGGTLLLPPNPTQEQMNTLPVGGDGVIKFGEAVLCTVTFDSQGGSAVGKQNVLSGNPATKPADPALDGCAFGGWYKEPGCETAWDFENDAITAGTTLYAKWIPIRVESVTLNKTDLTLTAGESEQLTATVVPGDAADKTVTWASSDTAVATVDASGNVAAVGEGTATITVTTADGGKTASCAVTVIAPVIHVTGVTLNKTDLTLTAGGSEQLTATVVPGDAADKTVTWASSDTAVATVDASGNVTAAGAGTAIITATTADGGKTAACTVTVNSGGGYVPPFPSDPSTPITPGTPSTSGSSAVTVPVSGDQSTVRVSASVSGSTATVSRIDTAQIDRVIGDNGQAGMVEIDFTGLGGDIDTVTLPAGAVKDIAAKAQNEEIGGLTVRLPGGEVSFDAKALAAIQTQAGSQITLAVTRVKSGGLNDRQKEAAGGASVFELTLRGGSGAVIDFSGGHATVSLPYELTAGQDPDRVVVYHLDSAGNSTPCDTRYDVQTRSAVFTTGHFAMYFVGYDAAAGESSFSDVAGDAWHYDAVRFVSENGLMGGYGNGLFGPDDPLSRAQFA